VQSFQLSTAHPKKYKKEFKNKQASRYNAGGETVLYYHGEYSRFDEMAR